MKWSVVICTHNRCADLRETLENLAGIDYPADAFEVIVVDNASADDTGEVVEGAKARMANLKYLREEKIGLSHARNTGIDHARGELVAFLDDDAWPQPDWLGKLEASFRDPRVACAGGRVLPVWKQRSGWPEWLHHRLLGYFTVFDLPKFRFLRYPVCPVGTNVAFRKAVFAEIGRFDPRLGRTGASLLSGEEADLCVAADQAGYRIAYSPEAVVRHQVHENRLTPDWIRERAYWSGVSSALIERKRFGRLNLLSRSGKFGLIAVAAATLGLFFGLLGDSRRALYFECQSRFGSGFLKNVFPAPEFPQEPERAK